MSQEKNTSLLLSQLLEQVEQSIKRDFSSPTWIRAEIMELQVNRRGHCYIELIEKSQEDESIQARARATIWASKFNMLKPYFETAAGMPLKSGIKILCKVNVGFHKVYGFSINITDIDPAYTLGDLARKKQEVIRQLREEGVMDMNRELPFPTVPQNIAVISSETAAGYGDFMDSIQAGKQHFHLSTHLFQASMQGDEAPASIMAALDEIHASDLDLDCVVLIRGGGSRADLECFNDYELAYYITQFPLPVVTGIGHERDESVADLVAARALKTPTAVAEFLIEKLLAFDFNLSSYKERLSKLVEQSVKYQQLRLERLAGNLKHMAGSFVQRQKESLERSELGLRKTCQFRLEREKEKLSHLEVKKDLVNPVNVLKRGYSMTIYQGKVLFNAADVAEGSDLETRLNNGIILSKVKKTISSNDKGKD